MLENDYNIIKPVENMSNVGALTPIDQHSQKRRRQEKNRDAATPHDTEEDGQDETATPDSARTAPGSIDYRA